MVDLGAATGFAVVFLVIGGLELFDRTSIALIAYASRSHGFASWAGAAAAFLLTTGLAVSIGAGLVGGLGPDRVGLLRVAGGAFLLGYAGWVYAHIDDSATVVRRPDVRSALVAAFTTIFLLELGDTTMIFEIVFVANWGWVVVLVSGSAALLTVAAWNVYLGRTLGSRISPRTLNRIVVVVLTIVGALTVLYGLVPSVFPSLALAAAL